MVEKTAKVRREDKVAIMLSSEMKERLEKVAAGFGMPPSTMCAFAVAAWVQQQENQAALARMAVLDIARKAGEKIDDVDLDAIVKFSQQQSLKSVDAQGLLTLDHEEPKGSK